MLRVHQKFKINHSPLFFKWLFKVCCGFIFYIGLTATMSYAQPLCPLNGQPFEAREVEDVSALADWPVLHDGRIKPLSSYARHVLLQLSGRTSRPDEPALDWFVRLLLAPQATIDDAVFMINHEGILQVLNIEKSEDRRYSYQQIQPKIQAIDELVQKAVKIENKQRDLVENELIRLWNNLVLYNELSLHFAFAFPHPDFTVTSTNLRDELGLLKQQQFSFWDIASRAVFLNERMKPLEKKPQSTWNHQDRETVTLTQNLFQWHTSYQGLKSLAIIPDHQPDGERFMSIWTALMPSLSSSDRRTEIAALRDVMIAYWNNEQIKFQLSAKQFRDAVLAQIEKNTPKVRQRINLELLYNRLDPFLWAKILYIVLMIFALMGQIIRRSWWQNILFGILGVALFTHMGGVIARMIILMRPPVSTLYETFVFVGFIVALSGLIIDIFLKNGLGALVAAIGGSSLLMIANRFAQDGDTLKVLEAVLNSNFWLSTHVITITIGYGGVCVAAIVAHIYMLQAIMKPQDRNRLMTTQRVLMGTLGFGLTMTFLGTNLGGIWADQSWGRFWGWDPKENGALMIVLWSALLFHLRLAGLLKPLGFAVGNILGLMVVVWAWFGVNLLSIGLHSYGFTSGLMRNLIIYAFVQLLFITVTYPLARQRLLLTEMKPR